MSEYMFGVTQTRVTAAEGKYLDRVCEDEGGTGFTTYSQPGTASRGWFTGPNRGEPFDRNLSHRVCERVRRERPALATKMWGEPEPAESGEGAR